MMKKLISWLRPSLEDDNGQSSYRRLSAFVFVSLACYMVIGHQIPESDRLHAFYALLITFLLLTGIVTVQNILQFLNRDKQDPDKEENKEIIKTGDQVTISKEE